MAIDHIIGIDLGTTKSVVAAWVDDKIQILPNQYGHFSTPSVVVIGPDGRKYVGEEAQEHPKKYQGEYVTISSIKRKMGTAGELGWLKWRGYPQEISGYILSELKQQAEVYFGEPIERAVIAVPAHFDANQRWATWDAAIIAGLKPLRLMNEATATALAYGFSRPDIREMTILVFDFGGGTLDISVIEAGEGVYEVLAVEGDTQLGGDDFDKKIADYILKTQQERFGSEVRLGSCYLELKEVAEDLKIRLSTSTHAELRRPGFVRIGNQYKDLQIRLDRKTFEDLSRHLLDRALEMVEAALQAAKLNAVDAVDLDALLLTGGSSGIPYLKESLQQKLGIKPSRVFEEKFSVATGAAIQAAVFAGQPNETVLLDVIPRTLSLETLGGIATPLIDRNTTIPTEKTKMFTTTEDNSTAVTVNIFEGERRIAKDNVRLGTLVLNGILSAPRGIPQIDVTFTVDHNGLIHVSARDKATETTRKATITSPYRLNKAQISRLRAEVETRAGNRLAANLLTEIEYFLDPNRSWVDATTRVHLEKTRQFLTEQLEAGVVDPESIKRVSQDFIHIKDKVEKVHTLIEGIDSFLHEYRGTFNGLVKHLREGRKVIEEELREGILSSDLVAWIQKDFKQIKAVVDHAFGLTERVEALRSTVDNITTSDRKPLIQLETAVQELQDLGIETTVDLAQRIDRVTTVYHATVTSLFTQANEATKEKMLECKSVRTALRKALISKLLGSGHKDARKVLSGLNILYTSFPFQLTQDEAVQVLSAFKENNGTELTQLLLGSLKHVSPDKFCDFYISAEDPVKQSIQSDRELRKLLEKAFEAELATPIPRTWVIEEISRLRIQRFSSRFLGLLDHNLPEDVKLAILRGLAEIPTQEAVIPLIKHTIHEKGTLQGELLSCLTHHEPYMQPDIKRFYQLIRKKVLGQPLRLGLTGRLLLLRLRHSEVEDAMQFLKSDNWAS